MGVRIYVVHVVYESGAKQQDPVPVFYYLGTPHV